MTVITTMTSRILPAAAAAALAAAGACLGATAQTPSPAAKAADKDQAADPALTNTITIERIVVPEQRAAARPAVSPSLLAPRTSVRPLAFAEYTSPSQTTPMLSPQEAVAWGDSIPASPYRGYAAVGYLPGYNLAASAGWRLIDTRATRAGVWLQFDGQSFKAPWLTGGAGGASSLSHDPSWRSNAVTVGADLRQSVGEASTLTASVSYGHVWQTMPLVDPGYKTGVNDVALAVGWGSQSGQALYSLEGRFGMFGFTKGAFQDTEAIRDGDPGDPCREYHYGIGGDVAGRFGAFDGTQWQQAGVKVDADFWHYGPHDRWSPSVADWTQLQGRDVTRGLVSATPYCKLASPWFTATLGVRLDVGVNSGNSTLHVAPDLMIEWNPRSWAGLWASATGGQRPNTEREMWRAAGCQLAPNSGAYFFSGVPYALDGGVRLGPWQGASLALRGGWAKADRWMLPVLTAGRVMTMTGADVSGWHIGATASYQYRQWARLDVDATLVPQHDDDFATGLPSHGYYLWRDHASWEAAASLTLWPVEGLEVAVAWTTRHRRTGLEREATPPSQSPGTPARYQAVSLGQVSDLSATASYRITPAVSAWVRVHNICGAHWLLAPGVPAPRAHGLAGVSLKF